LGKFGQISENPAVSGSIRLSGIAKCRIPDIRHFADIRHRISGKPDIRYPDTPTSRAKKKCVILSHKIVKNEKIANLCGEKLDNAKKFILANFWPIWVIFAIFIAKIVFFDKKSRFIAKNRNFFNFDHLQGQKKIFLKKKIFMQNFVL
jgi:hypothetical protein